MGISQIDMYAVGRKQTAGRRRLRRYVKRRTDALAPQRGFHPPRSKTGAPEWFQRMLVLSRIPVTALDLPQPVAKELIDAGIRTVWKLSQAGYMDLLRLKGIGPATLKKLRAQLVERSVPVAWVVSE